MNALLQQQLSASGLVHLHNAAGDTATISLYGAQVLSWSTASHGEQLYCSERATSDNNQSIRGGIPVCFPQFSGFGELPKHGVVRTVVWAVEGEIVSGADVEVARAVFRLQDNAETRAHWPYAFTLHLHVALSTNGLDVTLHVHNADAKPLSFAAALHTYLSTSDVRKASVASLSGQTYVDTTQSPHATCVQTADALSIPAEVDYIYYDAPPSLTLTHKDGAQLALGMTGFKDTVIWNPGPEKVRAISDMTDCDWVKMLCIEAVQFQQPVVLQSGETWQGTQQLRIVKTA